MAVPEIAALATVCYLVFVSIRRIYFSRVSHIPGPRLAALTYWYQFFYEGFPHHGQFVFQLGRLHDRYGPIVRIGPDEVHINDIAFYSELYTSHGRKRDKSPLWFWMAGEPKFHGNSAFSTLEHDLHRIRRGAFSQFFSKRKAQQLESRIRDKVLLLKDTLLSKAKTGDVIDLRQAFSALNIDVISEYAFGRSIGAITAPDMGRRWTDLIHGAPKVEPIARMLPGLMKKMDLLPTWLLGGMSETIESIKEWTDVVNTKTEAAYREAKEEKADMSGEYKTVLHEMVRNEALPAEEKTYSRINADGTVFLAAGTETTSRTLAITMYHILANPSIHSRLLGELSKIFNENKEAPVAALEQLPFMKAVVDEGLRIAHGTVGRFSRIAPDEDLVYNGLTIPRGVTMSQTNYLIHTGAAFPDPHEFRPERFLDGKGYAGVDPTTAYKSFVPFGKGTRACVGLNLAYAELYCTLASLLTEIKMELYDTHEYDVRLSASYFVGWLPDESKGIRVKILGAAK